MPNLPSVAGEQLGLIAKGRTTRTLQLRLPSNSQDDDKAKDEDENEDNNDDFANAASGIALSSIFWDWFYNYLILSWPQHSA
ncbi:hypothetical protein ACLKA7_010500 [Drosophila subpalustris]